ncbi:MAG: MarR family winged helix-turn-helix transcriptional regulator [Armatimonadota bacterium]
MPNDESIRKCAMGLMDAITLAIRVTGGAIDKNASSILSIQQFRALISMKMITNPSLSQVADHMGVTISMASKIIDAMVERGYILRNTDIEDRRKLVLSITKEGENALEAVHMAALGSYIERLQSLTPAEREVVNIAADLIRSMFRGSQLNESQEVNV